MDSDAALKVDSDISDSILRLHIATADGDYATATQEMSAMKTAVLKRSYSYESLEQIDQAIAQTRSDISSLQNQLSGATSVKPLSPESTAAPPTAARRPSPRTF